MEEQVILVNKNDQQIGDKYLVGPKRNRLNQYRFRSGQHLKRECTVTQSPSCDHAVHARLHIGNREPTLVVRHGAGNFSSRLHDRYVHLAQVKNYVVAYERDIGLLINFGAKSLQFKKAFNSRKG